MESVYYAKFYEDGNIHLFTLDAKKLYPNIQPELLLQSIDETLLADKTTDKKTKKVIQQLIRMSIEHLCMIPK